MKKNETSTKDMKMLRQATFFGNEKTPLAYIM
jgi:hypothetical protein